MVDDMHDHDLACLVRSSHAVASTAHVARIAVKRCSAPVRHGVGSLCKLESINIRIEGPK